MSGLVPDELEGGGAADGLKGPEAALEVCEPGVVPDELEIEAAADGVRGPGVSGLVPEGFGDGGAADGLKVGAAASDIWGAVVGGLLPDRVRGGGAADGLRGPGVGVPGVGNVPVELKYGAAAGRFMGLVAATEVWGARDGGLNTGLGDRVGLAGGLEAGGLARELTLVVDDAGPGTDPKEDRFELEGMGEVD